MAANTLAFEYEESSQVQKEHGLAFIHDLSIPKGIKVLDLGCGTGYLTKILAGIVGSEGSVVALDNDVLRLNVARGLHVSDNLEYVEGRCEDPYPGEEYDLIFSNYVFHWVERMDLVFRNAYKSLKVGGKFAFLMSAPHDTVSLYFDPPGMVSLEYQTHLLSQLRFKKEEELKKLATGCHFEVISFVREEKQMTFAGVDGFIQFLRVSEFRGKVYNESHFNRSEMLNHFGAGSITMNYPIFKAIFIKN